MRQWGRLTMLAVASVLAAHVAWAADAVRVTAEVVNLRSEPSTSGQIMAPVSKGTVLAVIGREGSWIRVATPGSGYASYVHMAMCEEAPGASPTSVPAATAVPAAATTAPAQPAAMARQTPPATATAVSAPPPRASMAAREPVGGSWDDYGAHFSPNLSFGFFGDLGVGGRLSVGLSEGQGLGVLATADYFFGAGLLQGPDVNISVGAGSISHDSSGSAFMVEGYAVYRFDGDQVKPYAGGGISYYRASSSNSVSATDPYGTFEEGYGFSGSNFAPSVIGGVRYGRYFGDLRYRFGDIYSAGTITIGMSF